MYKILLVVVIEDELTESVYISSHFQSSYIFIKMKSYLVSNGTEGLVTI